MSESRLRRIIRRAIKESNDNDNYSEKKYPYHHKMLSLFEHFFNKDYWNDDAKRRVEEYGFRGQVKHIIEEDFYDEGLSDLLAIPNFLSIFVKKGIHRFRDDINETLGGDLDTLCDSWNNWIENSNEETLFKFIDSVYKDLNVDEKF